MYGKKEKELIVQIVKKTYSFSFAALWFGLVVGAGSCHAQKFLDSFGNHENLEFLDELVGVWHGNSTDVSYQGRSLVLVIGRASTVTTDWPLPVLKSKGNARTRGPGYANFMNWNAARQLSSLEFQFIPIQLGSRGYASIPIYVGDVFRHSYLLKCELSDNGQVMKVWGFADGPKLKALVESRNSEFKVVETPEGIFVANAITATKCRGSDNPFEGLFGDEPLFTFTKVDLEDVSARKKTGREPFR